jgi:hypothetical protein
MEGSLVLFGLYGGLVIPAAESIAQFRIDGGLGFARRIVALKIRHPIIQTALEENRNC